MIRALLLAALLASTFLLAAFVARAQSPEPQVRRLATLEQDLARARAYNRRLERVLRREVSRAERNERELRKARTVFRYALHHSPVGSHWLEVAFLCIYRYEHGAGGWASNTGNGYDGGLQMDDAFQRSHGGEFLDSLGPAYRWPRSVQIAVAIDAHTNEGRGFGPWPNTRRKCGV